MSLTLNFTDTKKKWLEFAIYLKCYLFAIQNIIQKSQQCIFLKLLHDKILFYALPDLFHPLTKQTLSALE